jgi:hypothetical protein
MTLGELASRAKESAMRAAERSEANKSVTAVSLTKAMERFFTPSAKPHSVILRACDFISLRKKLWPEVLMNLRCLKRFSQ